VVQLRQVVEVVIQGLRVVVVIQGLQVVVVMQGLRVVVAVDAEPTNVAHVAPYI
jgi:hypothetical protein